jgi:hypothetical protein
MKGVVSEALMSGELTALPNKWMQLELPFTGGKGCFREHGPLAFSINRVMQHLTNGFDCIEEKCQHIGSQWNQQAILLSPVELVFQDWEQPLHLSYNHFQQNWWEYGVWWGLQGAEEGVGRQPMMVDQAITKPQQPGKWWHVFLQGHNNGKEPLCWARLAD